MAISVYMPDNGGCRAASFDVEAIRVLVGSHREEDNERVQSLAAALAKDAEELQHRESEHVQLKARIADLEARLSKATAAIPPKARRSLLGPGFVRFFGTSEMWLLNRLERGFGEFGLLLEDGWDELFRRFNVRVVENGQDAHGPWWRVENIRNP